MPLALSNSDGSFVPPLPETALAGRTGMTLPVIVETSSFTSELVLTNWSATARTIHFLYAGDALQSTGSTANFDVAVNPGEQILLPDLVQRVRDRGGSSLGPTGPSYVGPLFATVSSGDLSGLFLGARTSTPGGGGSYGLFYTAVPYGSASTNSAWLYGLQQDGENRTNLALVNTGETDQNQDVFRIELFDGSTGLKVNTVEGVTLNAQRWFQIGTILARYAPAATQGYAHVTRSSGSNPFITYAVINEGGQVGQRSGDGAFITSSP